MFDAIGCKNKLGTLELLKKIFLRVNQLSYSLLVHWITNDQLLFEGSLPNEWTVAILAESDFLVLLLDPAFQMNGTHRVVANFCKETFYL